MDREKVIKALEDFNKNRICLPHLIPWDEITDALVLLKEPDNCENCAIAIENRQLIVRCKDCIHRGKSEKCVLAAISEEKDYPLFMLDNRGEWFCADGERKDT